MRDNTAESARKKKDQFKSPYMKGGMGFSGKKFRKAVGIKPTMQTTLQMITDEEGFVHDTRVSPSRKL